MVQSAGIFSALAVFVLGADAHGWITSPMSRVECVTHHWQDGMPDDTLRYCPSCTAGPNSCGATDNTYVQPPGVWKKFYESAGVSAPELTPGEQIEFTMRITADHGGQAWMLLSCEADEVNETIPWHIIPRASGGRNTMPSTPHAYAWAMGESGGTISTSYVVPQDFSCPTGRGVGRWLWKTAHQCNDANNMSPRQTEPFSLKEFTDVVHQHSPGVWVNEECAAVPAEEFIACFDFTTATGPAPPAPPPAPPSPTPAPLGPCHAVSPVVSDDWCQSNCHATSPDCPPDLCQCDHGLAI